MQPDNELELLNESARHYRWSLANIVVALICVAIAGSLFVMGHIKGGFVVIAISGLAVFNATTHRKKGDSLR